MNMFSEIEKNVKEKTVMIASHPCGTGRGIEIAHALNAACQIFMGKLQDLQQMETEEDLHGGIMALISSLQSEIIAGELTIKRSWKSWNYEGDN